MTTLLAQAEPATEVATEFLSKPLMGNELWRYGVLLTAIIVTLIVSRIVRAIIVRVASRLSQNEQGKLLELFMRCLAAPASVGVVGAGVFFSRLCMRFQIDGQSGGLSERVYGLWGQVSQAVIALAVAFLMYRLVDIVEYYLKLWTARTQTSFDDMIVPVVRKGLRIFIAVVAILFIADNILQMELGTVLATAGVGGLAIALAAQETVANFFGSINIFADQPFRVGERIKVGGFDGPVEEVGFRSTRIRTLDGHLVTIPNSKIANEMLENIGRRPFIKRVANITITYDTPPKKVERAVAIIKEVLAGTEEVNRDPELVPRVYFSGFNDWSLNILVIYWVTPPDYWLFQEVNQRVNLAIMRGYEAEGIEFAFPTQTLYHIMERMPGMTGPDAGGGDGQSPSPAEA